MSEEAQADQLPDIDETVVSSEPEVKPEGVSAEIGGAHSSLDLIMEVPLRLSVEIGTASMAVRDVLALSKGSIVELNRMSGDPADVYANDRLIARGELQVKDERVAIRITELVSVQSSNGDH